MPRPQVRVAGGADLPPDRSGGLELPDPSAVAAVVVESAAVRKTLDQVRQVAGHGFDGAAARRDRDGQGALRHGAPVAERSSMRLFVSTTYLSLMEFVA